MEGFLGGVAADEPQAALIGRDVLSRGGTAVDAAVAMSLALSVTLPSSAGLGGGGVCVVRDHASGTTEVIDFLPPAPAAVPPTADRPSAIPAMSRGLFAMHSRYGRLPWGLLVGPAEKLARFGVQVSRALARDMGQVGPALLADRQAQVIFGADEGQRAVREGDFLTQLDLAVTLGRLRTIGPGDLYSGQRTKMLIAAVAQAGGSLSAEDLRDYVPVWRETIRVPVGNETAHFAPPPAMAGVVAAQMLAMLADDDRYEDASPAERAHLVSEAAMRAFADRRRWLGAEAETAALVDESAIERLMVRYSDTRHLAAAELDPALTTEPENPAAAGLVAVDRDSNAVACNLTMNNLFGTGRVAPGTGILLAAAPGRAGRGTLSLGPVVVSNDFVNEFFFAAAASGGVAAPTALAQVTARVLMAREPLEEATAAPRVHNGAAPDVTFHEPRLDLVQVDALRQRGHQVAPTPRLGLVNALACPDGIPPDPETCTVRADPRGYGLAGSADQ